jgi:hypothetical protein
MGYSEVDRRGPVSLFGLAIFVLAAILFWAIVLHGVDEPCPRAGLVQQASEVRLVPSIIPHQSWVAVPSERVSLDMQLVVCVDGLAIGRGSVDDEDMASPNAVINVPTHWVDWLWLSGRLQEYQDPTRWLVVSPS